MGTTETRWRGDRGFTLVEVMVALGLLAMVLAAATALFTSMVKSSAEMDRREYAVTLAQRQMELVRAVNATFKGMGSRSRTGLVEGRALTEVAALQTQASALGTTVSSAVAATNLTTPSGDAQGADPRVTGSTSVNPAIELTRTDGAAQNSGLPAEYTTRTFVGTCELPYKLGQKQVVTNAEACVQDVNPASLPSSWGIVTLVRVVVAVSWATPGCTPADCVVSVVSLIDPNSNSAVFTDLETTADPPTWSSTTVDGGTTPNETAKSIDALSVLKFGSITWSSNQAKVIDYTQQIRIDSPPVSTTNTACSDSTATPGESTIQFVPAPGCWGIVTFGYTVVDVWGRQPTGTVTVTVTVLPPVPVAVDDVGSPTTWVRNVATASRTIAVLPNDSLTPGVTYSIGLASPSLSPTWGTVTVNTVDSTLLYTPPATWPSGSTGFTAVFGYSVTDSYGQADTAQVSVQVNRPTAPTANVDSASVTWHVTAASRTVTVDVTRNDEVPAGPPPEAVEITGSPCGSCASVSGLNIVYVAPATWPGATTVTLRYRIIDATGQPSPPADVLVQVLRPEPLTVSAQTYELTFDGVTPATVRPVVDDPSMVQTYTKLSAPTPDYGSVSDDGTLTYRQPSTWPAAATGSSYTVTFQAGATDLTGQASKPSGGATVTITVTRPRWTPPTGIRFCAPASVSPYNQAAVVIAPLTGAYGVNTGTLQVSLNGTSGWTSSSITVTNRYRATVSGTQISVAGLRTNSSSEVNTFYYRFQYDDGSYPSPTPTVIVTSKRYCP